MDDHTAPTGSATAPAVSVVDDRLTVMGLLSEISTGLQARIDEDLAPAKLTTTEFGVLLRLFRSPAERLRMTDLAAQVNLSNSGLTRLVDRLERAGHLRREACPHDRRGSFAVLTPEGTGLVQRLLPGHVALLDRWLFEPLSPSELSAFATTLRLLRDHISPAATAGSGEDPGAAAAC